MFRPDHCGKVRQDPNIHAIGRRQVSSGLSEISNLTRIGDHDGEPRLHQRTRHGGLKHTGAAVGMAKAEQVKFLPQHRKGIPPAS